MSADDATGQEASQEELPPAVQALGRAFAMLDEAMTPKPKPPYAIGIDQATGRDYTATIHADRHGNIVSIEVDDQWVEYADDLYPLIARRVEDDTEEDAQNDADIAANEQEVNRALDADIAAGLRGG